MKSPSCLMPSAWWLVFFAALGVVHVHGAGPTTNLQDCVPEGEFDPQVDYFPDKFVPHETVDYLTIQYFKNYKIINNKYNKKQYLFYQCGTEPPSNEVDSGMYHLILPVPHTAGIAITETPQITPIEQLGKRQEIIAQIGDPQYISSPCLMYMMDVDKTVEVIFNEADPRNATWTANATAAWITENPEAIILGGPIGNEHGDRVLSVAQSQERTNVATFDWIGLYAALFNLEAMANEIAKETEARYDCSAANAVAVSADIPSSEKPVLLWASYFTGIGWSVAECPTPDSTYYCEYAQHCGANILSRPEGVGTFETYGGTTKYWYLTDEEFLELGKDAQYWIYPSNTWNETYTEKKDLLDQIKAVQDKKVFDTQGQGCCSWNEQRLSEYDVVALDFCHIIGRTPPTEFEPNRWFRDVYTQEIGSLPACNAPDELALPYVPAEAQCTLMETTPPPPTTTTSAGSSLTQHGYSSWTVTFMMMIASSATILSALNL